MSPMIIKYRSIAGKVLIDKGDHLLSRCVVESKFHMNALRGLKEDV